MTSEFRALTFNVRREGEEHDVGDLWDNRKQAVIDLIKSLNASIIGLQEVRVNQLAYLVDALSPDYVHVGDGRDRTRGGEFSPVFVRTDDFEVKRGQTLWISQTPEEAGSRHPGAHCPRVLTCVELCNQSG